MTPSSAFPPSIYIPIALGFFGLGTGYIIYGGQALFNFPPGSRDVDHTMAMWGFWMPGFMQFMTGVLLFVGLTWFPVFTNATPLYMAALAFTAFGVHWFALAHRRYIGSDPAPDGWMAVAFLLLSSLGVIVFASARDFPVMIVFIGLSLIYLTEILSRFNVLPFGFKLIPVWQLLTGLWLMYMTYAVTLNIAVRAHWWV